MTECAIILSLLACGWGDASPPRSTVVPGAMEVSARIDALAQEHWQAAGTRPAEPIGDAGFLRRLTLDLAGRIPTASELTRFTADASPDKRRVAIKRLMDSPEYALHLGNVLDEFIQGQHAGDGDFVSWLRRSIEARHGWDELFRAMLQGPWDTPEQEPAVRFLSRRVNSLDEMTNDTARVFFGVNIACAKCHDHPLVADWKQDHYFGLASFLSRTHEIRDRKPPVAESDAGEVSFVDTSGGQHTARLMFLAGQVIEDPLLALDPKYIDRRQSAKDQGGAIAPPFSPRDELVRLALADERFFSRAVVNRIWANLLGRGLVHPVDQMHSKNPPSLPGVLEYLAEDLARGGFDLDRLVAAIVSSRVYALASDWSSASTPPSPEHFAIAQVRPLTHQQFAMSLLLAAGEEPPAPSADPSVGQRWLDLEGRARNLTEAIDRRRDGFQSSAAEALFVSNDPRIQELTIAAGTNLAARLSEISETDRLIDTAVWTILSRPAESDERSALAEWFSRSGPDSRAACGHLVWALAASAEFRFNH